MFDALGESPPNMNVHTWPNPTGSVFSKSCWQAVPPEYMLLDMHAGSVVP